MTAERELLVSSSEGEAPARAAPAGLATWPRACRWRHGAAALGLAGLLLLAAAALGGAGPSATAAWPAMGPARLVGLAADEQPFLLVGPNASDLGLMCLTAKPDHPGQLVFALCDLEASARLRWHGGRMATTGGDCVARDMEDNRTLRIESCGDSRAQEWVAMKEGQIASSATPKVCIDYRNETLTLRECADLPWQHFSLAQPSDLKCIRKAGERYPKCQLM